MIPTPPPWTSSSARPPVSARVLLRCTVLCVAEARRGDDDGAMGQAQAGACHRAHGWRRLSRLAVRPGCPQDQHLGFWPAVEQRPGRRLAGQLGNQPIWWKAAAGEFCREIEHRPGGTMLALRQHPRPRGVRRAQPRVAVIRADEMNGRMAQPRLPHCPAYGGCGGGRAVHAHYDPPQRQHMCHGPPPSCQQHACRSARSD